MRKIFSRIWRFVKKINIPARLKGVCLKIGQILHISGVFLRNIWAYFKVLTANGIQAAMQFIPVFATGISLTKSSIRLCGLRLNKIWINYRKAQIKRRFTAYLYKITRMTYWEIQYLVEIIKKAQIKRRFTVVFRNIWAYTKTLATSGIFAAKKLITVFATGISRVRGFCPEHGQVVFRAVAVLFIGYAFTSMFFPITGQTPPEYLSGTQPVETGVGGGYLGTEDNGIHTAGELSETAWLLETGILEPESFSQPRTLLYSSYTIRRGDIIGDLAASFGLNPDTIISLNNIRNARLLQIGQVLRIPNQDGIMYTMRRGDTIDSVAERYNSSTYAVRIANELFSDAVSAGTALFIPGARLDWMERQEINGDLFIWPAAGRITSPYGWRTSPFSGGRQFHSGIDIGAPMGAPVRAAMSGRVSTVGWDNVLGNYIVITHHSGYRTLYAHLSAVRVRPGAYVGTGERIGNVGNTGQSTGPHLHFTVYRNGVTINPRTLIR